MLEKKFIDEFILREEEEEEGGGGEGKRIVKDRNSSTQWGGVASSIHEIV